MEVRMHLPEPVKMQCQWEGADGVCLVPAPCVLPKGMTALRCTLAPQKPEEGRSHVAELNEAIFCFSSHKGVENKSGRDLKRPRNPFPAPSPHQQVHGWHNIVLGAMSAECGFTCRELGIKDWESLWEGGMFIACFPKLETKHSGRRY